MSRETKPETAVQHSASADRAPSLDAEHDPAVSRQASLAGLRRELELRTKAGHKPVSDATAQAQGDQHTRAGVDSHDGVKQALALSAVRIDHAATGVVQQISTMTERGPTFQADQCRAYFLDVTAEIRRLQREIGGQADFPVGLAPGVQRLDGAFDRFAAAWQKAQAHFPPGVLGHDAAYLAISLAELNRMVGVDYDVEANHDASRDGRKDDAVLKDAIQANLEAAQATAHSVRMGLTTGKAAVVEADLHKLGHHVVELAAELRADFGPRVTAKSYDKALLKQALAEIHALQQELAARPSLAGELTRDSTFKFALATLEDLTGAKPGSSTQRDKIRDIKGRIVRKEVHDTELAIVIGSGADQGITEGMKGYLVDDAGHRSAGFTVHSVTHDTCLASVTTGADDVRYHPYALINPAKP